MAASRPAAAVVLLGCPKNRVDAEEILGALGRAGYAITTAPETADVIVVTTCAFLRPAVRESEAAIRRALALRRRNPGLRVVVAGCLVQRLGRSVLGRFPGIELAAGIDYLTAIPRLLRLRAGFAASGLPTGIAIAPRLLSTPGHYAYLKLADGCDNNCGYCLIPAIRGRLRSRPVPALLREATRLARAGVRELILVAHDTTAYGRDIYRRPALPRLLNRLARIPGVEWLRLMYTHPARLSAALVREFEHNPRLCRYLDIPVQHVSDRILARMNRGYGRADLERLVTRLRSCDDLHLRTTVIVGFPGETEAEFAQLLEFLQWARFDRLGAYAYSPEPGTRAAALRPRVAPALQQERLAQLLELQARISRRRLGRLRGRVLRVLADGPDTARTEWDAPEVDGIVRLSGAPVTPGEFVNITITGSDTHDLSGRVAQCRPGPAVGTKP